MGSVMDDEATGVAARERRREGLWRRAPALFVVGAVVVALGVWGFVVRPQERPALDAAGPTEVPDPCSLLDSGEMEAILGPVGELYEGPGMGAVPGQRACVIPRPEAPGVAALVGLIAFEDTGFTRDDGGHDAAFELLGSLGAEARWRGAFRLLVVAKGQWLLTVQMLEFGDPEETTAQAERVAAAAITRL